MDAPRHAASIVALLAALAAFGVLRGFAQSPAAPRNAPDAEPRVALVIGNGGYGQSPLSNPVNDARDIARALEEAGFSVMRLEDASYAQMVRATREFGDRLQRGGVGLFFYAGHGMQVRGRNYLIPVGSEIEREDEVSYQAIDANLVLEKMESAHNRLNIVILDACRNNPFARSFRSGSQGLAQMDAPAGTLIAFATAPGAVAADGGGRNGLYTQHLLSNLREPGLKVEDVFKRTRQGVRTASLGRQVPWENTSLEGDFFFRGGAEARPAPTVVATAPATSATPPRPESARVPEVVDRPRYAAGDLWIYAREDLLKGDVRVTTFEIESVTDREIKTAFGDVFTLDGAIVYGKADDLRYEPSGPRIPFPLKVGSEERHAYRITGSATWPEWEVDCTARVVGVEAVNVPAGSFDAFRIEIGCRYRQKRADGRGGSGTLRNTIWYSPQVKREVMRESEGTNWRGDTVERGRIALKTFHVR